MENFIIVAEAGSFSAAAERLYISPQALIQQIAKMENELGFRLFIRSSKGVRLSPGGEEYYSGVKSILSQYYACTECAARKAKKSGVLRIGLPDNINSSFLLSSCSRFTKKYPEIRLHYEKFSIEETAKALQQGRVDICAQIRSTRESRHLSSRLFPVRHYCLVRQGSPLAVKAHLRIEDLSGYTVGVWGPLHTYKYLSDFIAGHALDIRLRSLPENFGEVLIFCMEDHVLLTCTPVIESLRGALDVVPIDFDFKMDYYLAYRDAQSEAVQLFLQTAREVSDEETNPLR